MQKQNPTNPNHHKLKIVFIGDSGVGKSSIINRYCREEFSFQTQATVGVQFATR
jgi:GTPase SAR1 family protein